VRYSGFFFAGTLSSKAPKSLGSSFSTTGAYETMRQIPARRLIAQYFAMTHTAWTMPGM
jgi:hypothetical protein